MLARYVELVIARPEDESAVQRLLERAASQPGGVDGVASALAARSEGEGAGIDVALGAIAMARGREAEARAALERAIARDDRIASAHALAARLALRGSATASDDARRAAIDHQRRAVERAADAHARELYLRELATLLLEEPDGLPEVRRIHAELERGGSPAAQTELVRLLASHGHCEDARADFPGAMRAVASDASATVGLALLRAQCETSLRAFGEAHDALDAAWSAALRSGRVVEILDAMLALARETDGLAALERELASRGPVASLHRGVVLEELGREEDALGVLREVLRRSPRDAETRQRVAHLLARNGRLEEALDEQRTLARLFPERIALTLELATALRDHGQPTEALAVLDRARSRARGDRTALFLLVDAYARLGARDRVLATLESIVRASPDDPRAIVALANELLETHDPADRERALALVERIGGSEAGVVGQVEAARALANLRVFDRAFEHLEAAARIDPDAPEVLDAQADLFVRASRDADAERALERRIALAADSTDPAVLEAAEQAEVRLVASWARRGSIPEHRADLEARHARGDASASRMLADVQRRAGQLDAALATLVALSERRPDDARLVAVLARLHHERGDYDAEVRALLRLSELEPARAGWHLSRLVELALATYRDDDAIRFADEATRRSLDDPELHLRLGRLHARRRDPTRAALAYARAIELDPDAHEAAWELAGLERERGASRRALELLLGILVRSRDDDLRERAGRALLETARADGSEESLEPRLLALALAHGDAPVFQRLALSLYTALTVAARARGDEAAIGRWVSRSLPVLLTALRDDDVGARSSARQLLFAHPVPGASQALLAMAADESVDTLSRQEALAAALHVITERDGPALEALLSSPSEVLASLALHGLARLGERSPRAARSRLAALRVARARPGRVGMNAWALTILVGGETLRDAGATAGAAATSNAWLDGWAQAATSAVAPSSDVLRALLLRHAARRERDDPTLHPQIDLLASGLVDDASLDALARAALVDDEHGRIAMRALLSRPRPTLACAPVPARAEGLEGWMERAIAGCPRTPREPEVVVGALLRAVAALGEAGVPAALELVAAHGREASWGPIVAPVATALVRRTLPVAAASPDACLSLVALAQIVPDLLTAEDWRALLARPERTVRAAAAAGAPVPGLSAPLVDVVVTDPAWTVRRAALQRLAVASIDPSDLERAVSASLVDDSAFVRSEAISLAETLSDARACALLGAVAADPDPWVLERVRSVTSRRCAR